MARPSVPAANQVQRSFNPHWYGPLSGPSHQRRDSATLPAATTTVRPCAQCFGQIANRADIGILPTKPFGCECLGHARVFQQADISAGREAGQGYRRLRNNGDAAVVSEKTRSAAMLLRRGPQTGGCLRIGRSQNARSRTPPGIASGQSGPTPSKSAVSKWFVKSHTQALNGSRRAILRVLQRIAALKLISIYFLNPMEQ